MSKYVYPAIALFLVLVSPIFASQTTSPSCFTTQLAESMDFILDTSPESNTSDIDLLLIEESGIYTIDNEIHFTLCYRPRPGINPKNTCKRG